MEAKDNYVEIVKASLGLFLRNGYNATTIRMISKATGLHIGSIYYAFESKDGILARIMEAFVGDTLTKVSMSVRATGISPDIAILPSAIMLEGCSRSRLLARLLAEALRIPSVLALAASMSVEWGIRYLPDAPWTPGMASFLLSGVASLAAGMFEGTVSREEAVNVLLRYVTAITGPLPDGTDERILALMSEAEPEMMWIPVDYMDEMYGGE